MTPEFPSWWKGLVFTVLCTVGAVYLVYSIGFHRGEAAQHLKEIQTQERIAAAKDLAESGRALVEAMKERKRLGEGRVDVNPCRR